MVSCNLRTIRRYQTLRQLRCAHLFGQPAAATMLRLLPDGWDRPFATTALITRGSDKHSAMACGQRPSGSEATLDVAVLRQPKGKLRIA